MLNIQFSEFLLKKNNKIIWPVCLSFKDLEKSKRHLIIHIYFLGNEKNLRSIILIKSVFSITLLLITWEQMLKQFFQWIVCWLNLWWFAADRNDLCCESKERRGPKVRRMLPSFAPTLKSEIFIHKLSLNYIHSLNWNQ